jgi:glycosyltransferase involved in cell wall biosynthesis
VSDQPLETQPREIFIVCNSVDEMGGLTRWAHHMAGLFSAAGHPVHIIGVTPATAKADYGRDLPYKTTTLYAEHPASKWAPRHLHDRLNFAAKRRESHREADRYEAAARMSRIFRLAKPDAVIIVAQVWAMEWVALADTNGLPVIGMSHESYAASKASSRYRRVKRYYGPAARMLVLTREDADLWARDGMPNAGFMPNPSPLDPREDVTPGGTEKVVVSLGRLSYEKGYDLLLEAWAKAAPEHPDWSLRIFGTGDQGKALREQAVRLGLTGSVDFAGQTDDVPAALVQGSVFALASRAEGFPMSLMEAMASGLPSVAFDCAPGVREVVTEGEDGFLVTTGNTDRFAEKLTLLMGDADLRATMGFDALENVRRFSGAAVVSRWERLFRLVHS